MNTIALRGRVTRGSLLQEFELLPLFLAIRTHQRGIKPDDGANRGGHAARTWVRSFDPCADPLVIDRVD